jgi:hypothetical protein
MNSGDGNYVSYTNMSVINNKSPFATILGDIYNLSQKKSMEGLENKSDVSSNYTTRSDFQKTYGTVYNADAIAAIKTYQIGPTIKNEVQYESSLQKVNKNYYDLSNNIGVITNKGKTGLRDIMMDKEMYDFSGNVFHYTNPIITKTDGLIEDVNTMAVYQNSIYVMGAITSATLLVAAVLLAT